MYVIRPQFFVPLITLLRNAAREGLRYKTELAQVKQTNIDVTNFEEKLEKFKTGFGRNFDLAARKFDDAIKAIDKSIADMQKARDSLVRSKDNLRLANDKAEGLTIRKLTHKNPTMAARFKDAREAGKLSTTGTTIGDEAQVVADDEAKKLLEAKNEVANVTVSEAGGGAQELSADSALAGDDVRE